MQAVMKQATFPAIIARKTSRERSLLREGAIALNAPSWIPIDPRLENPHNAYVAIASDLALKQKWGHIIALINTVYFVHFCDKVKLLKIASINIYTKQSPLTKSHIYKPRASSIAEKKIPNNKTARNYLQI